MNFENFLDETKQCFVHGEELMQQGKPAEALGEFTKALELQVAKFGEEHDTVAICHVQLGMSNLMIGTFEEALEHFDRALAISLKTSEYNSQEVANCYYLLGTTNMQLKDYEEASLNFGHVVIISCNMFGPTSKEADAARSLYNKAMLLNDEGKVTPTDKAVDEMTDDRQCFIKGSEYFDGGVVHLAVKYFKKAIELKKAKGEEDDALIDYYRGLAISYTDVDMQTDALEILDIMLPLCQKLYGEDSKEVAGTYNLLGYNMLISSKYDEAINYLDKVLKIHIKLYGDKHPEVVRDYSMIGDVYRMKGDKDKAIASFEACEKILDAEKGEDAEHGLINCYGHLSSIYGDMREYNKQIEYLEKAVTLQIKLHGEINETVVQMYNSIAYAYHELGDKEKSTAAINNMDRVLQELQAQHGDECTCGCGHDHHHDDEECSCGHHHHDDDEECSCGHHHHDECDDDEDVDTCEDECCHGHDL